MGAGFEGGDELVDEGNDRQRAEVDPVAADHLQQEVERPLEARHAEQRHCLAGRCRCPPLPGCLGPVRVRLSHRWLRRSAAAG